MMEQDRISSLQPLDNQITPSERVDLASNRLDLAIGNKFPNLDQQGILDVKSKLFNTIADGITEGYNPALLKRLDNNEISLKIMGVVDSSDTSNSIPRLLGDERSHLEE